jgi:hypothetical protein
VPGICNCASTGVDIVNAVLKDFVLTFQAAALQRNASYCTPNKVTNSKNLGKLFRFVEKLKANKLLDIPHIANSKFTLC